MGPAALRHRFEARAPGALGVVLGRGRGGGQGRALTHLCGGFSDAAKDLRGEVVALVAEPWIPLELAIAGAHPRGGLVDLRLLACGGEAEHGPGVVGHQAVPLTAKAAQGEQGLGAGGLLHALVHEAQTQAGDLLYTTYHRDGPGLPTGSTPAGTDLRPVTPAPCG